jgi:predicted nucleic acid-binding protein
MTFIDANIILRYLTRPTTPQDQAMFETCSDLFDRVQGGEETITTCEAILSEVVYVLGSSRLYNLPPADISARLKPIIGLSGFRIDNKRRYLRALDFFVTHAPRLDFEDALAVTYVEGNDPPALYSFDRDFDRVPQIDRREP